jgi:hypothetical protein
MPAKTRIAAIPLAMYDVEHRSKESESHSQPAAIPEIEDSESLK